MTVELVMEVKEREWSDFLELTPGGSIFQSPDIAEVYRRSKGYEPLVVAVLSGSEIQALLASTLVSHGPGAFSKLTTRDIAVGAPLGDRAAFPDLLGAHDAAVAPRALFTQIRNLQSPEWKAPFLSAGYEWEDHLNFLLDLREGEEALISRMSKARTRGIAAAERVGMTAQPVYNGNFDQAYELIRATYDRAGVPLADRSLFRAALDILNPQDRLMSCVASLAGETCAARFVLRWNDTLYDWYAGSSDLGRAAHADEWLVWEIVRNGMRKGCTTFDFGGAGPPSQAYGPREFKRRFGGTQTNPGRFRKVYRPLVLKLASVTYNLRRTLKWASG